MTSPEVGPWSFPIEAEVIGEERDGGESQPGAPAKPGPGRSWGGKNGSVPAAPTAPPGSGNSNGSAPAPAAPAPAPPPTPGAAAPPAPTVPSTAPAQSSATATTTGTATGTGTGTAQAPAPAPPPAPPAREEDRPEPEPFVDPETLAQMAPMAMMAGAALLPMIGSALSGLLGGGAAPVADAGGAAMDPQSQQAMKVLKTLDGVYGEGEPTDPDVKKLGEKADGSEAGTGDGPAMVKAKRLFQANRAGAFNRLDKQLGNYISTLGGSNKVDQNALRRLVEMTNAALAELGPIAYTKEGQQKVRQILTAALQTAHKIVSGGTANNGDAASAINQLTNQYLYNIIGKELPGGVKFAGAAASTVQGGSDRAQFAMKTALAQIGDPYVWGSEGPNSFDCSGLMQYAARQAGVNIPRVANDQYRQLPAVNPADIQPGDLIFPSTSWKNGRMGHVMMYIGNGQVVHAPRAGEDVQITSLPRSYQARRFA